MRGSKNSVFAGEVSSKSFSALLRRVLAESSKFRVDTTSAGILLFFIFSLVLFLACYNSNTRILIPMLHGKHVFAVKGQSASHCSGEHTFGPDVL